MLHILYDVRMPRPGYRKTPPEVLAAAAQVPPENVDYIWELWKGLYAGTKGKSPKLSPKRAEAISIGIAEYGFETCVKAVIGTFFSPWHMGDNPSFKRYTSIELILRWGQRWRVSKFVSLYKENSLESNKMRDEHEIVFSSKTLHNNLTVVDESVPKVVEE